MSKGGCRPAVRGSAALELWCCLELSSYPGLTINNMSSDWRTGVAFCALVNRFRPDLLDMSAVSRADDTEQWRRNCELAFNTASEHMGIPALLEPKDVVNFDHPDKPSILTYTAQFYHKFAKNGQTLRRARSASRRRGAVLSLMEDGRRARSVSSLAQSYRPDSPPIEQENPFTKGDSGISEYQEVITRPRQFIPRQRLSRDLKVRSLFLEGSDQTDHKENIFLAGEVGTGARPRHVLSYSSYAMPYRSCELLNSNSDTLGPPSTILSLKQNNSTDSVIEQSKPNRKKSSKLLSNFIKNGVEKLQQVRRKKSSEKGFEKKIEDSVKYSELHTIL